MKRSACLPVSGTVPGNPTRAVRVEDMDGHEVPWQYQLFLADDRGRVPVDFPRPLRRHPARFRLSAELLGVEIGTRFEIDVLAFDPTRRRSRRTDQMAVVTTIALAAEPGPVEMAGCRHDMGDYPAEVVYSGDRPAYQHYRCNGCDIILRTETL